MLKWMAIIIFTLFLALSSCFLGAFYYRHFLITYILPSILDFVLVEGMTRYLLFLPPSHCIKKIPVLKHDFYFQVASFIITDMSQWKIY